MREVTKKEFYDFMNPRDVSPNIISDWDNKIGYIHEWKTRAGLVMGRSQSGDGCGKNKKYWLN